MKNITDKGKGAVKIKIIISSNGLNMFDRQTSNSPKLSRRKFLKITAAAGGLLAGTAVLGWKLKPAPVAIHQTRVLMGTVINLTIVTADPQQGQAAIEATFAEMERLIGYFDHRQPAGLAAQLNQRGLLSDAPPELVEIIEQSIYFGHLTGGAFDISVKPLLDGRPAPTGYRKIRLAGSRISFEQPGMAITLDGIAKGRVIDGATTTLRANGFDSVLVEAGGDLVGAGRRADGQPWRVGVANPRTGNGSDILAVLPIIERAAATSGDYMNYFTSDFSRHHIIDPRTGVSPTELASVTVLAPTAIQADALSTAVMVLGRVDGLALLAQLPAVEGLVVTKAMHVHRTAGFPPDEAAS